MRRCEAAARGLQQSRRNHSAFHSELPEIILCCNSIFLTFCAKPSIIIFPRLPLDILLSTMMFTLLYTQYESDNSLQFSSAHFICPHIPARIHPLLNYCTLFLHISSNMLLYMYSLYELFIAVVFSEHVLLVSVPFVDSKKYTYSLSCQGLDEKTLNL